MSSKLDRSSVSRRRWPWPRPRSKPSRSRRAWGCESLERRELLSGVVSVTLQNTGGAPLTNPQVRFAEVFADGDIPSGSRLALTLPDGTPVPYTAARVNSWPDGSVRTVDILAEVPSGKAGPTTIAPGGTLPLTIAAQAGAFNNALPGGRSVADVVADIRANNDPIGVKLLGLTDSSGATVGSGTWVADSTTAFGLSGADGGYSCVATGPTAADFVAWMKLRDPNNGNAASPGLWAQFYITAFLDPKTGAVEKLSWRTWLNQGIMNVVNDTFDYRAQLTVGNTVVRSWGFAGDGRDQTFAPTAVDLKSSQITLPGHGFVDGQMVRFSSTGTLPGGLSPDTDYWVKRIDANHVQVYPNQLAAGTFGSPVKLTSQGSGTLTVEGYVQILPFQRQCLAGPDGNFDWSSGRADTLAGGPTIYAIHDSAYYVSTGLAPPIDLSVDMNSPTQAAPEQWAPGTNGAFYVAYNTVGARKDIGAVWNEWAAEALANPADYAGYVQTARVQALAMGSDPIHFVNPSTLQIPVLNPGTYAGLGTAMPHSYYLDSSRHSADIPSPRGTMNSYTNDDGTHSSFAIYPVYITEGGQDLLDLVYSQANHLLMNKMPDSLYMSSRNLTYNGRTYYSFMPSSETRQDAWRLNALVDALTVAPDGTPERSYFGDLFRDTADLTDYFVNTLGSASWRAAGGWDIEEAQKAGVGVANASNSEDVSDFMQTYLAMSLSYNYVRTGDAALGRVAAQEATYFTNKWVNFPNKAFNVSYQIKIKEGPGSAYTQYSPWQDWGILDGGSAPITASGPGGLKFADDGTVTLQANGSGMPQIPLQVGDRVYLTRTSDLSVNRLNPPPSQLQLYTWYYVRQAAPDGLSFKLATANSDATIVTSYTPADHIGFYSDVQNRTTNLPDTIYRHNTYISSSNGGYLTLNRAATGYLYLAGLMPLSGFQAADAFFQKEVGAGIGPGGFSTTIFQSVDTSLHYKIHIAPPGPLPNYPTPSKPAPSPTPTPTPTPSPTPTTPPTPAPTQTPGVWQYDFGTATSPLAAGYTQVIGSSRYSDSAGFGWLVGQVDARDRGPVPGVSDLTRDFATTADGTFGVNLPDGTYTVAVTLGDAAYAHGPIAVYLQGTQVDSVTTAAGKFADRSYQVTISGGRIELRFKNTGLAADTACIESLQIVAAPPPAPTILTPASTNQRQYDFGTSGSPTAAGYTRVTPTSTYTASAGFGWLSGSIDSRDRGAVGGASDLTCDFNSTQSGVFAVDLPNGTYSVAVTLGDACYAHGPMGVSLEGTQVDTVKTAAGQFVRRVYQVTVADGRLELGLKNLGISGDTVTIAALEIAPASTDTAGLSATLSGPAGQSDASAIGMLTDPTILTTSLATESPQSSSTRR